MLLYCGLLVAILVVAVLAIMGFIEELFII